VDSLWNLARSILFFIEHSTDVFVCSRPMVLGGVVGGVLHVWVQNKWILIPQSSVSSEKWFAVS